MLLYFDSPTGANVGGIDQRRTLEVLSDDRRRLSQVCRPDSALDGHAMDRFRGEYVFDLALAGRVRQYLGPAVVGVGLSYGKAMMFGQGLWPTFGKLTWEPGETVLRASYDT